MNYWLAEALREAQTEREKETGKLDLGVEVITEARNQFTPFWEDWAPVKRIPPHKAGSGC